MTNTIVKSAAMALLATVAIPAVSLAQSVPLIIGMSTTPTTLDPHEDSSAPNNATSRHIWDSLIDLTGTSANEPELATEWKAVDPTHWEFKLREGVKFHDGSTFDAQDVIASLLRARDKPSQGFASYTRNIVNVTAKDPLTVVVETSVPDPLLLNSVSRIRIISADCAEAPVQDFDNGKCAIGTGAYVFSSFSPGDRLVLKRNEDYFAGASHWSDVTLRFLPDDGARLASLLSNEIDIIEALPADGMARVEESSDLQVINGQSSRFVYIGMDVSKDVSPFVKASDGSALDRNPLKDERVRRAILMAINRPAIVERVMQKNGTVADQFVAKGYMGHSDAVEPVGYDPAAAKALLAEAGYPEGFRLTLHGPSGRYVKDSEVVQAVGQMLARIGIQTQVEVQPWSMYSDAYANGDFSMFLGSWGVNTGETTNPTVALVATRDEEKGTGRYNGGGISDAKIDEVLAKASSTLDEAERLPLLEELSKLTFDKLWLLPMHYENVVLGAKASVRYTPRGDKYTLAYFVEPAQ
ncbi:ABC transporter substrate-binding protein [Rhizobium sp. LC145]|uniref:ABC transporter substrate-binding protein n=1 Tax=Rhizobium sp. LC145 TaxID=1120688 RepID=UPI000629E2E6|nr:ABC transporter substrate-binding protein [Rhizobium sp. LC145]KKX24874.1 ABC transporter substrate-binding protein [Rhizobium sp. LC145]TKT46747.1 ABC transporter substrate-binding protein [Rhizobiaceae bacterium LC148]